MTSQMKVDDEVRLMVLDALQHKGNVQPIIQRIKKKCRLHKATIKASIDFLEKQGTIASYGPRVIFKELGYNLEVLELMQVDLSEKKTFDAFLNEMEKDVHIYMVAPIIGTGNLNLVIKHVHKDVESFHNHQNKNYYQKIPGLYKIIQDRRIFYLATPLYKNRSRSSCMIEIARQERGLE